jgi:hypothetical protein
MKRNERIEATAFLPEEASKETDSNVEDKREQQQHDQDYSFIDHQDTHSTIHR